MLLAALLNILGHDNRGDLPTEVLLMAAYGETELTDRPLTTAVERMIPTRNFSRGQSLMELLTPRELSQTTETRPPATTKEFGRL